MFDDDDDWLFLFLIPPIETKEEFQVFLFVIGVLVVTLGIYMLLG